ncbi:putative N-acetyltransferase domain-containing protein [Seiridium cardinale]|uniref:N-acetyltransferase domain-containing protein n=1 Tax=Seiridium cardinale TaxID=138064 RepID=A0ABR2XM88_9PEZI
MPLHSGNPVVTTTVPTPPTTPAQGSALSKPHATRPIFIGRATEPDAPAIAKLGGDTFTATFGHSVSKEDLEDFLKMTYSTEAIEAEFADPSKTYLVARTTYGNVVGIAQLHSGQTHSSVQAAAHQVAVMQKVYVDITTHGQGIGSKLITAIEQLARDEGAEQLWLTVWEENVKAQRLYHRLGYKKTGEIDFATGTCIQTDHVLAKRL